MRVKSKITRKETLMRKKKFENSFMLSFKSISTKSEDDNRYITGYASTDKIDHVRDKITAEALMESEKDLLRPGTNTVFYNHDRDRPIGKVVSASYDGKGLLIKALISKASDVEDIWIKIKEKILSNFSVSFIPKKMSRVNDDNGNLLYYSLDKIELLEVSVVGLPCNMDANVTDVVGKKIPNNLEKITKKKSKGLRMKNAESSDKSKSLEETVKGLLPDLLKESQKSLMTEIAALVATEIEKNKAVPSEKAAPTTAPAAADTAAPAKSVDMDLVNAIVKALSETAPKVVETTKTVAEDKPSRKSIDEDTEVEELVKPSKKDLAIAASNGKMTVDIKNFINQSMNDSALYESLDEVEKSYVKNAYILIANDNGSF